jgi:transcriptional regulator NrdR family protein
MEDERMFEADSPPLETADDLRDQADRFTSVADMLLQHLDSRQMGTKSSRPLMNLTTSVHSRFVCTGVLMETLADLQDLDAVLNPQQPARGLWPTVATPKRWNELNELQNSTDPIGLLEDAIGANGDDLAEHRAVVLPAGRADAGSIRDARNGDYPAIPDAVRKQLETKIRGISNAVGKPIGNRSQVNWIPKKPDLRNPVAQAPWTNSIGQIKDYVAIAPTRLSPLEVVRFYTLLVVHSGRPNYLNPQRSGYHRYLQDLVKEVNILSQQNASAGGSIELFDEIEPEEFATDHRRYGDYWIMRSRLLGMTEFPERVQTMLRSMREEDDARREAMAQRANERSNSAMNVAAEPSADEKVFVGSLIPGLRMDKSLEQTKFRRPLGFLFAVGLDEFGRILDSSLVGPEVKWEPLDQPLGQKMAEMLAERWQKVHRGFVTGKASNAAKVTRRVVVPNKATNYGKHQVTVASEYAAASDAIRTNGADFVSKYPHAILAAYYIIRKDGWKGRRQLGLAVFRDLCKLRYMFPEEPVIRMPIHVWGTAQYDWRSEIVLQATMKQPDERARWSSGHVENAATNILLEQSDPTTAVRRTDAIELFKEDGEVKRIVQEKGKENAENKRILPAKFNFQAIPPDFVAETITLVYGAALQPHLKLQWHSVIFNRILFAQRLWLLRTNLYASVLSQNGRKLCEFLQTDSKAAAHFPLDKEDIPDKTSLLISRNLLPCHLRQKDATRIIERVFAGLHRGYVWSEDEVYSTDAMEQRFHDAVAEFCERKNNLYVREPPTFVQLSADVNLSQLKQLVRDEEKHSLGLLQHPLRDAGAERPFGTEEVQEVIDHIVNRLEMTMASDVSLQRIQDMIYEKFSVNENLRKMVSLAESQISLDELQSYLSAEDAEQVGLLKYPYNDPQHEKQAVNQDVVMEKIRAVVEELKRGNYKKVSLQDIQRRIFMQFYPTYDHYNTKSKFVQSLLWQTICNTPLQSLAKQFVLAEKTRDVTITDAPSAIQEIVKIFWEVVGFTDAEDTVQATTCFDFVYHHMDRAVFPTDDELAFGLYADAQTDKLQEIKRDRDAKQAAFSAKFAQHRVNDYSDGDRFTNDLIYLDVLFKALIRKQKAGTKEWVEDWDRIQQVDRFFDEVIYRPFLLPQENKLALESTEKAPEFWIGKTQNETLLRSINVNAHGQRPALLEEVSRKVRLLPGYM